MVPADALRCFADVVTRCGGHPKALLAKARIAAASLAKPHAVIPHASFVELLERAGRQAQAIDDPGTSAGQLAGVADRWLDLGDVERGKKLAREARARAEKPRPDQFPDPRDNLALALARIDLTAALGLLEGRDPRQRYQLDTIRAGIARRVAATDPAGSSRSLIHTAIAESVG